MQLPLFPLSSVVLPDGLLPLRLFETRYIDMVKDCFRNNTGFGVCLIRNGNEAGEPAEPYPQGTSVSIVDFDQGSDGLLHITVKGEQEFSVSSYTTSKSGLLIGEVDIHPARTPTVMKPEYELLAQKLAMIMTYLETDIQPDQMLLDDPDWISHRLLEVLPLTRDAKFELLQLPTNQARLDALGELHIEIAERS